MCQGRCQRKCERFGFKKPATCGRRQLTTLSVSAEGETVREDTEQVLESSMVFPTNIVELTLERDAGPAHDLIARCA